MSYPEQDWRRQAACTGLDPGATLFFGLDGERGAHREARDEQAKAVCSACSARLECLTYAIGRPEKYGTWGGFSEEERAAERRRRMRRTAGYAA